MIAGDRPLTRHEFAQEVASYGPEALAGELQRAERDVQEAQAALARSPHDRAFMEAFREAAARRTELRRAKGRQDAGAVL